MSVSNPPQEPTNDLREAELDELLSTLTTPFREWLQPQLETLLARRQKELIDEILGQLPEERNTWVNKDLATTGQKQMKCKEWGFNDCLSEVTVLLKKMKGRG